MLIAALPQSTTESIARQYEIVSLIFIRKFFKDIAELDDIGKLAQLSPDVAPVFLDVAAGLLMFLLVTVFLDAGRRRVAAEVRRAATPREESRALARFILRKKTIAVLLTVLLVALAAYNLWEFGSDVGTSAYHGVKASMDVNTFYYTDVFTVMIFTDVLIVILAGRFRSLRAGVPECSVRHFDHPDSILTHRRPALRGGAGDFRNGVRDPNSAGVQLSFANPHATVRPAGRLLKTARHRPLPHGRGSVTSRSCRARNRSDSICIRRISVCARRKAPGHDE